MADKATKSGGIAGPLTTIAELMHLNILTLFCCIPVITAGASLTAMHAMLLKIVRNEQGYIGRGFFEAFRSNFKKATLLWLPFLMIFLAAGADYLIINIDSTILTKPIMIAVTVAAIISFLMMQFVFPLQSHFENTFRGTLSGAAILAVSYFPQTLIMAILGLLPFYLALKFILVLPLALVFGFTVPGYVAAKLYNPIFVKLEENAK